MNTDPAELVIDTALDEVSASSSTDPPSPRVDADTDTWVCQCVCDNPGLVHR